MDNTKNTNEDAVKALENAMSLLAEGNTAEANGGVCVWVTPMGTPICAPITQAQCAQIGGAQWVPGGKCPTK